MRRASADGSPAALGAVLCKAQDGYRIDHIYRSEPDLPSQRGPLDSPDLDVKPGDVITAVNGKSVLDVRDISDLLLNQADKQVLLYVKRGNQAAKPILISPITMAKQANLRYSDWEQSLVNASTKLQMARSVIYIYVPWALQRCCQFRARLLRQL